MESIFGLIPLVLLNGIIYGIYWAINTKLLKNKSIVIIKPYAIIMLLVGWGLFGFFTNLDNNNDFGCIGSGEPIFSETNILFSGVALGLVNIGFFASKENVIWKFVLIIELLFWLFKLFFIKGGYSVGYGGGPNENIVLFDNVALVLRLILMYQIFKFQFNILWIISLSFIIMLLRIY